MSSQVAPKHRSSCENGQSDCSANAGAAVSNLVVRRHPPAAPSCGCQQPGIWRAGEQLRLDGGSRESPHPCGDDRLHPNNSFGSHLQCGGRDPATRNSGRGRLIAPGGVALVAQRPPCVWKIYQHLQVFPTRGGWVEAEHFECFVLFQGRHKVF